MIVRTLIFTFIGFDWKTMYILVEFMKLLVITQFCFFKCDYVAIFKLYFSLSDLKQCENKTIQVQVMMVTLFLRVIILKIYGDYN